MPTFHMNIFEDATIRENDIRVIRKAFNIQYPTKMADMCGVLEKRIEKACLVRMPFTRQCLRPILMRLRSENPTREILGLKNINPAFVDHHQICFGGASSDGRKIEVSEEVWVPGKIP